MQLSQLENDSFTLEMLVAASATTPLSSKAACKLLAIMPPTPPLTLLAIATSIEGIVGLYDAVSRPKIVSPGDPRMNR